MLAPPGQCFPLTVLCLLCRLHGVFSDAVSIVITPPILPKTGSEVNITCKVNATLHDVTSLALERKQAGADNATEPTRLVLASVNESAGDAVLVNTDALLNNGSATTVAGGLRDGWVTLTMTRASEEDAGLYSCVVVTTSAGSTYTQDELRERKMTTAAFLKIDGRGRSFLKRRKAIDKKRGVTQTQQTSMSLLSSLGMLFGLVFMVAVITWLPCCAKPPAPPPQPEKKRFIVERVRESMIPQPNYPHSPTLPSAPEVDTDRPSLANVFKSESLESIRTGGHRKREPDTEPPNESGKGREGRRFSEKDGGWDFNDDGTTAT